MNHPGPNVAIKCNGDKCSPYIETNTTLPVNRTPLKSRQHPTSPDRKPV